MPLFLFGLGQKIRDLIVGKYGSSVARTVAAKLAGVLTGMGIMADQGQLELIVTGLIGYGITQFLSWLDKKNNQPSLPVK